MALLAHGREATEEDMPPPANVFPRDTDWVASGLAGGIDAGSCPKLRAIDGNPFSRDKHMFTRKSHKLGTGRGDCISMKPTEFSNTLVVQI
jgi:hypothetical protein